jgi:hypothetical protein
MELLAEWCVKLPDDFRALLTSSLESDIEILMLQDTADMLSEFAPWVYEDDEALSTAVFTILGIAMYCSLKDVEYPSRHANAFVCLYVNLDYALDKNDDIALKREIIEDIANYFDGIAGTRNKFSESACRLIEILRERCEFSTLKRCFEEEIASVVIQKTASEKGILYDICCRKSACCVEVIAEMIDVYEPFTRELGTCIQLFDDLFDLDLDNTEGNATYATYLFQEFGVVDEVVTTLLGIACSLPYDAMKIFFCYTMVVYCASSKYVSPELQAQVLPYYPLSSPSTSSRIKKWCKKALDKMKK